MSSTSQLLDRARTLATESASGTFTGTRSQLQSEFSSVLTEINRQATDIGMNEGGQFASTLSAFIGGVRDGTAHTTTEPAALANGSVSVNLSGSAVDTQSFGLQVYATPPNDTVALGSITGGLTGGVMDLVFAGPGDSTNAYSSPLTVAVQNLGTATSLSDVVSNINTAINQTPTRLELPMPCSRLSASRRNWMPRAPALNSFQRMALFQWPQTGPAPRHRRPSWTRAPRVFRCILRVSRTLHCHDRRRWLPATLKP